MTTDQMYSMDLGFYPMQVINEEKEALKIQKLKEEQEAYRAYAKQCKIRKMSVDDINRELEMSRINQYKRR